MADFSRRCTRRKYGKQRNVRRNARIVGAGICFFVFRMRTLDTRAFHMLFTFFFSPLFLILFRFPSRDDALCGSVCEKPFHGAVDIHGSALPREISSLLGAEHIGRIGFIDYVSREVTDYFSRGQIFAKYPMNYLFYFVFG